MTIKEVDGRWLAKKSPKAKTWEDVTEIIHFEGDFCSVMGKAGRTTFHAYLHRHNRGWSQMYGVTSILNYWGEKDRLVQWAVDRVIEEIEAGIPPQRAKTAHSRALGDAGRLGTDVHEEVEKYINSRLDGAEAPAVSDQAQEFITWAEEHQVEFLASEKVVYSKDIWCAGTLDFLCRINGKLYIGDCKTSNYLKTTHFMQLGAYAGMIKEKIDGVVLVHLPRSGGLKVVTNENVGVSVDKLTKAFTDILELVRMDKDISYSLYN